MTKEPSSQPSEAPVARRWGSTTVDHQWARSLGMPVDEADEAAGGTGGTEGSGSRQGHVAQHDLPAYGHLVRAEAERLRLDRSASSTCAVRSRGPITMSGSGARPVTGKAQHAGRLQGVGTGRDGSARPHAGTGRGGRAGSVGSEQDAHELADLLEPHARGRSGGRGC
ncbi:hypothetical protein SMICM304S_12245 [Streptomyces microflavus]